MWLIARRLDAAQSAVHTARLLAPRSRALYSSAAPLAVQPHMSFDTVGDSPESSSSITFLHGILGNKKNWRSATREFVKRHPSYRAIAVDLRGHGQSSNLDIPKDNTSAISGSNDAKDSAHGLSVLLCAQDTRTFLQQQRADRPTDILCGHSFGGKVALRYAQLQHESGGSLPGDIWILDCLPGIFEPQHVPPGQSVVDILKIVTNMPPFFDSARSAGELLMEQGVDPAIAAWLKTSLIDAEPPGAQPQGQQRQRNDGAVGASDGERNTPSQPLKRFSFDIQTLNALFHDFRQTDMWNFLEEYNGRAKIHFLRAERNNLWTPEVLERMELVCARSQGRIALYTMPKVGHWLHAENLKGTLDYLSRRSSAIGTDAARGRGG